MANLDSSWQSSVIKLAQAGNLRAIAFWINRYLVPQGICAQVLSEQPGHLFIRVVCHHAPDGDRLVRFICHRLASLHSQMIRSVRITAQLVGSSELLWEKSAKITPVPVTSAPATNQPLRQPAQVAAFPSSVSHPPVSATSLHDPVGRPNAVPPRSIATPATGSATRSNVAAKHATFPAVHPAAPRRSVKPRPIKPKRLHAQRSRSAAQQVAVLSETARQLATQSIEWFTGQTLPIRALTLGGSAIAVFFIGCGFELLRQYAIDPTLGRSASPSRAASTSGNAGTVQTAIGKVPVMRPTIADPDDPTITLLFSNSAALGQVSKPQMNQAKLDGTDPTEVAGGIDAYRQADLIMTSLDNPLTLPQMMPTPNHLSGDEEMERKTANLPLPEQTIVPHVSGTEPDEALTEDPEEDAFQEESELPDTTVQELMANGVDVVNLANDHPTPARAAELVQTLDVLGRADIQPVGAGNEGQEARRPQVFEVKGQRIAYLGYPGQSLADALATAAGLTPGLPSQMAEDIQAIRDQVDWVVVSFRWQRNLKAYPEKWQVDLAHLAIDQGADLVVGYHPHLTQGAEIYRGRAIAYSIGSSIEEYLDEYGGDYRDEKMPDRDTVTLKVTLKEEKMKLEFLPVQVRQGKATLVEGETGVSILEYVYQASSFFEQPMRSPTILDARVRLSLPSAPDDDLETDPFLSYPEAME